MENEKFNLIEYLTIRPEQGRIVWMCNIGAERYWHSVSTGIIDRREDIIVNRVEEINLLICRRQDIMILRYQPDVSFLRDLEKMGFEIPTILVPDNADTITPIAELVLKDKKLLGDLSEFSAKYDDVYFVPYAVTALEEQISEKCALRLIGSSSEVNAKVNDKIFNRKISENLGFNVCKGEVCSSVEEIRKAYNKLTVYEGFKRVIVKEPSGASGKGLYIIDDKDKLESRLRIIKRFSRGENMWLVEGWYNKKYDINFQIYVSPTGESRVFSIKQQILRDTVYIGSQMPPCISEGMIDEYMAYGKQIGDYLFSLGYTGVAGVDSIVDDNNSVIPIIEINGRFTLSTYISFLQKYFGTNKILTRYFRLTGIKATDYAAVSSLLENAGLKFSAESREGVVIYASGPLAADINNLDEYRGRLFTIITASDWKRVEELNASLEELIDSFTVKS